MSDPSNRNHGSNQGPAPRPRKRSPQPKAAGKQRRSPSGSHASASHNVRRHGDPRSSGSGRPPARKQPPRPNSGHKRPSQKKPRRWAKRLAAFTLLLILALGVTGCAVYQSMASQLPDPDLTKARGRDQTSTILDRNGKVLTKLFAEENRQDIPLEKMPIHLRQAVVATEDKRFFEHEGVDPIGIARALFVDVMEGGKAQGGSTITQQYVKQAFVTSEKTLKRKIQEAILAQRVERRYSKDQILELYLNTIYFGHGAYGVESAARVYFGKSATDLTVPESATLAGIIKSPKRYSPYYDADASRQRRDLILGLMRDQSFIDEPVFREAKASELTVVGLKSEGAAVAPYYVEWIKAQLIAEYGEDLVYRGGLMVQTTLDPKAQAAAEKAAKDVLNKKGDPSAAVVAVKPGTGEVLAMVGGTDFATQQFNVAAQGKRQPGSAFKPFVLVAGLQDEVWSEKAYKSAAIKIPVGDSVWSVTGSSGGTDGWMRLRQATEKSVNSVFAQQIMEVGAEEVVATGEKMGLHDGIKPVPAIALGGLEDGVSPLEMATAYATLAAGGKRAEPYGIMRVTLPDGTVKFEAKPKVTQAIDPQTAYITTDILKGVISRGTGSRAAIGRPAAGKTGTTQQYRDAWFCGYTPEIATAVWVGYADSQREMTSVHGRKVTGGSLPADIWARFMKAALKDVKATNFTKPDGLSTVEVCAVSGGKPTEFCPDKVSALVRVGQTPAECELHKTPTEVTLPSVVGLTKADAIAALEKLTLSVKVVEAPIPDVTPGTVATQEPKAATVVKPESIVTITVNSGVPQNQPPVGVITITQPGNAKSGEPVTFDGSRSTDDGEIVTYQWEFGDGASATGKTVTHTFTTPGDYKVRLWVSDDRDLQSTAEHTIKVN